VNLGIETDTEHRPNRGQRPNPKSLTGIKSTLALGLRSILAEGCPMPMVNVLETIYVLESTLEALWSGHKVGL
jgi:hypothetical protein